LAGASTPRPTVRGQAPDDVQPAVTKVAIPTPDQLGVAGVRSAAPSLDWKATRRKLDELGMESLHLERLSKGYRFTCWLTTEVGAKGQRIEADGDTEAEAIHSVLDKAKRWRSAHP